MSIMTTDGLSASGPDFFQRFACDLPGELRLACDAVPCRITEVSATGVKLDLIPPSTGPGAAIGAPDEAVVVIPSLGQYKVRRVHHDARSAAYLFQLTEFSVRALNALLSDRFPT